MTRAVRCAVAVREHVATEADGTELASTIVLWARAVGYDIADDATVASVRLALADLATDARDEWAAECEVMP